uniref:Uncharacterized protein n=1 Tax=Timema poppense TaxID=170557 RepID=A0A7R9D6T0_TIMPO|nr:unnamed protein product [Timema poppensis]
MFNHNIALCGRNYVMEAQRTQEICNTTTTRPRREKVILILPLCCVQCAVRHKNTSRSFCLFEMIVADGPVILLV